MPYHPRPNPTRALRQLDRHTEGPVRPIRQPSPLESHLAAQAHAALRAATMAVGSVAQPLRTPPRPVAWKLANDA
jgi:hypothetical protein